MLPTPIRLDQQGINSKAPQAKSNLNNPFQAIFLWCRPRPHSFNFSQWLEVLEKFGIPKKQIASVFDFNSTRALLHNLKNSSDQLKAVFIICADLTCPELPKFIQELWEFSPNTFLLLAVSENFNLNHQPPITPFFKVVDISNVSSLPLETLSKTCLDPQLPPQTNPPQTLTEISNWLEKISTDIQKQKSFLINFEFFPSIPWFCNQLLDLLNDSNTGILLLDSERKVIQVNYQIVEFLGLPPADCCGKPIWDLFESSSLGAEFFARVQAENRTLSTFASPQKPLFGKSQFLAYAKPIFLADNKFGFLVFLRNRSFEAESRDRLHIQETILNQVNDAIFLFNLERIVTFWNPAAERLYRLPAENVLGKHLPQGIRSDTHAFSKAWQTCIEKGEWIGELRQIDAEG
ncbi:MAG: PAS domain-containing protein, partial [Chthoniobacterales bacterium]|nr:PAS domain-containing protein [Chthoniobacterales bacterium]